MYVCVVDGGVLRCCVCGCLFVCLVVNTHSGFLYSVFALIRHSEFKLMQCSSVYAAVLDRLASASRPTRHRGGVGVCS